MQKINALSNSTSTEHSQGEDLVHLKGIYLITMLLTLAAALTIILCSYVSKK